MYDSLPWDLWVQVPNLTQLCYLSLNIIPHFLKWTSFVLDKTFYDFEGILQNKYRL